MARAAKSVARATQNQWHVALSSVHSSKSNIFELNVVVATHIEKLLGQEIFIIQALKRSE